MSQKAAEVLTFEFLTECIAGAAPNSLLATSELHDTIWQAIKRDHGVRIGDGESDLEPAPDGSIAESDAEIMLVIYARVPSDDLSERMTARNKSIQLAMAVAGKFFSNPTMNGRACLARTFTATRGFDNIGAEVYAVVNLPLVINESGRINFARRY